MDILGRLKQAPISCGAAIVLFLYGAWILGVNGYHHLQGQATIATLELALKGPGALVAAGLAWSEWGTLLDIAVGVAEKQAEEA